LPPELLSERQAVESGDIRVLCAKGSFREAAERAAPLAAAVLEGGGVALYIEVKALEAVALAGAGQAQAGREALAEALRAAAGEDFIRTFVDLGEGMRLLLADFLAARREAPGLRDLEGRAERLLSAFPAAERKEGSPAQSLVSAREREVLVLLAEGSSNREIADALYISEGTVKTHVHHLAEKLEAKSRGAIVQRARLLELLPR
jgi:LuxR family maltose regulon positive regulatory protein